MKSTMAGGKLSMGCPPCHGATNKDGQLQRGEQASLAAYFTHKNRELQYQKESGINSFVGPQHVPRPMGHLARGGDIRQEHKTARLLALAGYDLSPLVEGDLQVIPQRFDHAWLRGTRPSRAILGMRLDPDRYPVIRARQRPQLGSGGLGIRMTEILLPGRFAHG